MTRMLAFDFGASSGRAILGEYHQGQLTYHEIHRFENIPLQQNGHLRWNFPQLMEEVHHAIHLAGKVDSIAFDTWGVDFGMLDKEGNLLEWPVHYRDSRTCHTVEKATALLSAQQLYQATGNQILPINTLFQLLESNLEGVDKILFLPDLFCYQLCGNMVCEQTIASTSQLFDPVEKQWSHKVKETFGIGDIFAPLVPSGTIVGEYQGAKVIAVAGHDTQSAVAAIPTQEEPMAFLSCGTWSLLGCELPQPILTPQSREAGMSNEVGANGTIHYLQNITGLWLIQECRRQWQREGRNFTFGHLANLAEQATPMQCWIDPDFPAFSQPGNLPQRIQDYCRSTNQYIPQTVGEICRCIYESLAMKYRQTFANMQRLTGKQFPHLHIVGGGCQATFLCQLTADALGIPVKAGPVEATALGNLLLQLQALGKLENLQQGRNLIAQTEPVREYLPQNTQQWDRAETHYHTGGKHL